MIGVQGLASPIVPIRRRATPVTCAIRHRVRSMRCRPPSLRPGSFPPRSPPPLLTGLFERFTGTMSPSDSSPVPRQLRLLDFLSRPRIALAIGGQTRSPRFRRVPFRHDVVSDPGGATASRIATPHMLPSTCETALASAKLKLSRLNTHPTGSLCTLRERRRRRPRNTRYRAPATAYSGRTHTGWNSPACLAHSTTISIRNAISSPVKYTNRDARPDWSNGARSWPEPHPNSRSVAPH